MSNISPEDDLSTWVTYLRSNSNNILNLNQYIDGLERVVLFLIESDDFTIRYNLEGNTFLRYLERNVIQKISSLKCISPEEQEIMTKFSFVFIQFAISFPEEYCEECKSLLGVFFDDSIPLYFNNPSLFTAIKRKFVEMGLFDVLLANLFCAIEDSSLISYICWISFLCKDYVPDFPIREFYENAIISINLDMEQDLRKLFIDNYNYIVIPILSYQLNEPIEDELLFPWLEIFKKLFNSDLFDKKLVAIQYFHCSLMNSTITKQVSDWIEKENFVSCFIESTNHQENCFYLSEIFGELAKNGKINEKYIDQLWNHNIMDQVNDKKAFINILAVVASNISVDYLTHFVEICFNSLRSDTIFIEPVNYVFNSIAIRTDCDQINEAITTKLEIMVNDNSDLKKILINMRVKRTTEEEFYKLIKEILDRNTVTYDDLVFITNAADFIPIETELQSKFLNFLITLLEGEEFNTHMLLFLFKKVCNNQLFNNQLEQLFHLARTKNIIYRLLLDLLREDLIDIQLYTSLCLSAETCREFYDMISKSMFDGSEKLIWKLSIKNIDFQSLACLRVQSNCDEYNEKEQILKFLDHWKKQFIETPNDILISFLFRFISIMEEMVDVKQFGFSRHREKREDSMIQIYISGIIDSAYQYDKNSTIGSLMKRIEDDFDLNYRPFCLKFGNNIIPPSTIISCLSAENSIVQLKAVESQDSFKIKSLKTSPSLIISESDIMSLIYDYQACKPDILLQLLDILPTYQLVIDMIPLIADDEDILLESFFPIDNKARLVYHIDVLIYFFTPELSAKLIMGIPYLFDNIIKSDFSIALMPVFRLFSLLADFDLSEVDIYGITERSFFWLSFLIEQKNYEDALELIHFINKMSNFGFSIPQDLMKFITTIFTVNDEKYLPEFIDFLKKVDIRPEYFKEVWEDNHNNMPDAFYNVMTDHIGMSRNQIFIEISFYCLFKLRLSIGMFNFIRKIIEKGFYTDYEFNAKIFPFLFNALFDSKYQCYYQHIQAAFLEMIGELKPPVALTFLETLTPYKLSFSSFQISSDLISPTTDFPFKGIRNEGATCFFNTILQQLFFIPEFKQSVYVYEGSDVFMKKLKMALARLQCTRLSYISIQELIMHWRDPDGSRMDPNNQQDACEFLLNFFDKIEKEMGKELITSIFQGNYISHIQSLEDPALERTNEESFLILPLAVQNIRDFSDSLQQFSKPDYLTGGNAYKFDDITPKDSKKFMDLNVLPNHLIIQLKRFQYNVRNYERYKINSYFTFPFMWKKNNKNYYIKGIIVHSGDAHGGHYISFIRHDDQWRMFNDTEVYNVDEEYVKRMSFGDQQPNTSAYLLFYTCNNVEKEAIVPPELEAKIAKEDDLNVLHKLLFSEDFDRMIYQFARDGNQYYFGYAIKYMFNILPFSTHQATLLAQAICRRLKEEYQLWEYIHQRFDQCMIVNSLFATVHVPARDAISEVLKGVINIPGNDFRMEIIHIMNEFEFKVDNRYSKLEQLFDVLYTALKVQPLVHEVIDEYTDKFIYLLLIAPLNNFGDDDKKLSEYYNELDQTNFLLFMSLLNKSQDFVTRALCPRWIYFIINSQTNIEALINLYFSFPCVEYIVNEMLNISQKYHKYPEYFNLYQALQKAYFNFLNNK